MTTDNETTPVIYPPMTTLGQIVHTELNDMSYREESEIKPLNREQRDRLYIVEKAVEGATITIHNGLSAIGRILSNVGYASHEDSDDKIDADLLDSQTLMDLGSLIEGLAGLANCLAGTVNDAAYITSQQTWIKAASPLTGIEPSSTDQEAQS